MDMQEWPAGFSFALSLKPEALKQFTKLPEEEQSEVLQKARSVSSKREMQALIRSLTDGGYQA